MTLSQKAIDYAKQRGLTIGSGESKPSKLLFKDPSVNEEFNQLRPDLKSITETNPYGGRITSGYRDEQENEAVGGVPNSYHTKGLAVDIGLDDLTDKRIAYYKSKGLQPILESDHLHVEPPSDDWKAPVHQRSQTGLSQRAKAYAKERGLSYPGMETEPKTDTIQPKEEPSFLEKADYPGLLKSIGRGALVTAGQMADPALELAKRFNPTALGNEAVKAMGGIPVSNKYVDEPIDYLRGIAQKAAQTPLTEYEQNKGIDVTAPIAKRWPEYAQRGVEGIASGLGIDKESKPVQAISGVASGLAELGQGLTSPTNIAMLGMAGLPNTAQKVAAGAFAPMMLKGSEEGFGRGMEGLKTGNVKEAAAGLTSGVASAGLAGAAGMGALAEKPSMQQISDAMKARPMEFLDYPDATGAAKFDVPQLTAPKIKVAPREYIPEGKSKTYTSEPISALKKEPYEVRTVVDERIVKQRSGKEVFPKELYNEAIQEKIKNAQKVGYKLTRGHIEGLEALKNEIESAVPGRKFFAQTEGRSLGKGSGGVSGSMMYEPSSFPVKNLGTKDAQLAAINNLLKGKELTSNQKYVVDKLLEHNSNLRTQTLKYILEERSKNKNLNENLNEFDIKDADTTFDPSEFSSKIETPIASKPSGFDTKIITLKKQIKPYPTSYKAEATTPETLKTLDTQVKAMKAKKVPAVLVTPGEMTPKMTKGMMTLDTDVGKWIYDPMRINKQEILSKVEDGTYGEILGHVEPKSPKATQTVAAIMPDGTEPKTSIVSPENVDVQSQILKQQFPKSEIKVGGEELAKEVLGKRQATANKDQITIGKDGNGYKLGDGGLRPDNRIKDFIGEDVYLTPEEVAKYKEIEGIKDIKEKNRQRKEFIEVILKKAGVDDLFSGYDRIEQELAGQVLDQRNKTNIEAKEGLKSRVYERVQQEYPEILKDDVRYEKLTLKDDISKATDLLEKDPNRLYEIANDFDNRNEVNSTIANIVLSDKALRDGNHELYADLIKRRSLALTEKGQDISAEKASVNDNSTSKYVKQLLNERASQLSDTLKTADFKSMKKGEKLTKVLKDESAALKQKINKSMDLKAAQDIFDKLKCV